MGKLIQCSDCDKEISKNAVVCPNCGAKSKKTSSGTKLIAFLSILGLIGYIGSLGKNSASSLESVSPSNLAEPQLEVESFNCTNEYGYAKIQGRVKNLTSEPMKNVQAVLENFSADGTFISSGDALIEYNPIMPGQTSPFHAMSPYNPLMKSCNISFKSLMGGTIETIIKEKTVKKKHN